MSTVNPAGRRLVRSRCGSRCAGSGWFQVALPGVDSDGEPGVSGVTPQLAGVEAHGVEPLWVFAGAVRVGVREHVRAVYPLDDADLSPGVAGQPGVAGRVHSAGAHPVTDGEPGGGVDG